SQKDYETALKEAADVAKNVGQIGAAGTALLAKQDVGTAIHTAQTATENNLIPGLIAGGLFVWSAYDLYQTAQTEGPEAALKQAGVEVMVAVVGGTAIKQGFKIAGKLYPTAKAAWFAYVAENPIMAKIGDAVASAVERGKTWVGNKTATLAETVSLNPKNVALHEKHKLDLLRNMEAPLVEDGRLRNIVKDLYKKNDNPVGNGSTAAALRHEKLTGQPVKGKFHDTKVPQYIEAIEKWQRAFPNASVNDKYVAEQFLKDLTDALHN
ncbi:MAG: hypothetical protein ACRCUQ_01225, partial [Alphaproteobacteria bacterium]